MEDSILTTVKKLLGLTDQYTVFDADIILYINAVLNIMEQMGFPVPAGFTVVDYDETWSQLVQDLPMMNLVKPYIAFRVRKMFDPPTSTIVNETLQRQIDELEWRMNLVVDDHSFELEGEADE